RPIKAPKRPAEDDGATAGAQRTANRLMMSGPAPGTSPPSADPAVTYPMPDLTGINSGARDKIQDPAQAKRPQMPPPIPPAFAAGATPLRKEPSGGHGEVEEEETRERAEDALRAKEKEEKDFADYKASRERTLRAEFEAARAAKTPAASHGLRAPGGIPTTNRPYIYPNLENPGRRSTPPPGYIPGTPGGQPAAGMEDVLGNVIRSISSIADVSTRADKAKVSWPKFGGKYVDWYTFKSEWAVFV
ncbi:MAG: hypothetical protein AN484_27400, partial [Aphanizomenon flos-aquae WA102]